MTPTTTTYPTFTNYDGAECKYDVYGPGEVTL